MGVVANGEAIGMADEATSRTDVFVYGTLTDRDRVDDLLESFCFVGDAVIEGLHVVEGDYPTLAPGGQAEGRILRTGELKRLDTYEGVNRGLYVRVFVTVVEGDAVAVYIGDPDRLGIEAGWPRGGSFADTVQRYIDSHHVRVRRSSANR